MSGRILVAAVLVALLGASSSAQKGRSFQNVDLPPASSKDLHSISVKVARKGVHLLARRQRGN